MSTPTLAIDTDTGATDSGATEQASTETGSAVTYATPVPELMAVIARRAEREARERAAMEDWGMFNDPEERWADRNAQGAYVAYLAGAVATSSDVDGGEVLLSNTGPDAARFGYTLADRLDRAVGSTVVGFPCGEIDQPRAGVARYRHRPTPDRVLADGLRFCGTCALVIAGGDTSSNTSSDTDGDGVEQAAEAIAARWGDTGGHLVVSSPEDENVDPAPTVFDCDGCARTRHDRPVPGVLIRA